MQLHEPKGLIGSPEIVRLANGMVPLTMEPSRCWATVFCHHFQDMLDEVMSLLCVFPGFVFTCRVGGFTLASCQSGCQ
jgi:hypothetical protein